MTTGPDGLRQQGNGSPQVRTLFVFDDNMQWSSLGGRAAALYEKPNVIGLHAPWRLTNEL